MTDKEATRLNHGVTCAHISICLTQMLFDAGSTSDFVKVCIGQHWERSSQDLQTNTQPAPPRNFDMRADSEPCATIRAGLCRRGVLATSPERRVRTDLLSLDHMPRNPVHAAHVSGRLQSVSRGSC